ncbi:Polycomb group RING finger protein 6 [Acropora cervicornis]|uniref:Polycomb group RING finger protein 6 n=1 Tax=Acropora cervicornis TaxID=6130 RepID=A0AAD9UYY3_ACRCE|nr:Polycomb group RING finger protein 6 [Acropora cervicornis]
MQRRVKLPLSTLNEHIICKLCNGYLVDAATITECLHTFCKSCLVRHIELINQCPTCNTVIHETQPLYNIRLDRTMQDIVYKLLPKLEREEKRREHKFYKDRNIPYPDTKASAKEVYEALNTGHYWTTAAVSGLQAAVGIRQHGRLSVENTSCVNQSVFELKHLFNHQFYSQAYALSLLSRWHQFLPGTEQSYPLVLHYRAMDTTLT